MHLSDEMGKAALRGRRSRFWGKTSLGCVNLQILRHSNGDVRQVIGFMSLEIARDRFWTLFIGSI